MTTCATCARALQPAWKFCIYCGTPTGAAEEPVVEALALDTDDLDGDEFDLVDYDAELDDLRTVDGTDDEPDDRADDEPDPELEPAMAAEPSAEPDQPASASLRSRPLPAPVDLSGGVAHLEPVASAAVALADEDDGYPFDDDEPIDLPDDDTASPSIASLAAGLPAASAVGAEPDTDLDPDASPQPRDRTGSVNVLAMIALALAVLVSPLAALFGHLALNQLKTSGERGVVPAWIAVVLGYVWLGAAIVLGITYFAMNA